MKKFTFFAILLCCILGMTPQHTRAEEITLCSFYDGNGRTFAGWGGSFEDVEVDGMPCLKFSNDEKTDSWRIQACISADFEEGTTYTISFNIKGTPASVMCWGFQKSDGYEGRGNSDPFDFTENWSRVSITGTPNGYGADRILLNLGEYVGTLYISNLVITYEKEDVPTTTVSLITNGDCSTNEVSCFFDRINESYSNASIDPKERAFKVDIPRNLANEWDCGFFIKGNKRLDAGINISFRMKVKCTDTRSCGIQAHMGQPGSYVHYQFVGSEFTTKANEWVEYTWTGKVPDGATGCDIIAFNLARNPEAATIWFKDIEWTADIEEGTVETEGLLAKYYGSTSSGLWGEGEWLYSIKNGYVDCRVDYQSIARIKHPTADENTTDAVLRNVVRNQGSYGQPLTVGKTYRLTFDIAGTPGEGLTASVGGYEITDTRISGNSTFAITEQWQRVNIDFTATEEHLTYLYIEFGKYAGNFFLTNVYLYDADFKPNLPELPAIDHKTIPTEIKVAMPVAIGESLPIHLVIDAEEETSLNWKSSDESVAIVADGLVTGVVKGRARISISSINAYASEDLIVEVYEPEAVTVPVSTITIDPMVIDDAKVGDQIRLIANVMPENADDKSVTWSSSKEEVATVDESGLVTITAPGTAVITATANDGNGAKGVCLISGMSGIEDIVYSSPDEPKDIYTVDGKLIMRRATRDDINRLSQGVYLIGNQKIAIQ